MSLPIKLICKKSKARKDGTSIIFIQYCQSSEKRILLNTGIAVPPNFWNKKSSRISKDLPTQYGITEELQNTLTQQLRRVEDILLFAQRQAGISPVEILKQNFHGHNNALPFERKSNNNVNKLDVYKNLDLFIESKKHLVNLRSLNVYYSLKKHLKAFEEYTKQPITFECFDADFFESFAKFLTFEMRHLGKTKMNIVGFKKNTVARTIKRLKAFLRDRIRRKIIPFIDLSLYKTEEEEVDNIYLTTNEISKIYHLDLTQHQHLEKYRDLFVLGCLTGLRFSDYSTIKAEEIRDGMLYINQTKTLSQVVIPLRCEAKKILIEKYQLKIPNVTNQKFNFYIKEVACKAEINEPVKITHKRGNKVIEEIKPKYEWISSHTCRRSFCTNEFIVGTPTDLIMAISGHKSESSFKKYVKADQIQKAFMIKKLWETRSEL